MGFMKAVCFAEAAVSAAYLHGFLQRGVSVVWRFQVQQEAAVEVLAAVDELPRHGELLFQHFIDHKHSWIEAADI